MIKKSEKRVKVDFFRLTGIPPLQKANRMSDNCLTKNIIFHNLAEKIFDAPGLLELLAGKLKQWLQLDRSEFTYMLAGYVYYFKEEFKTADKFFLKAINLNPENLDNWFCLAFSLYHQQEYEHDLGKKILFNCDYCIDTFKDSAVNLKILGDKLKDL